MMDATALSGAPRLRVLFVDHSGLPGGGQLGLARFLKSAAAKECAVAVLGPGSAFDDVPAARLFNLAGARGLRDSVGAAWRLRRLIKESGISVVVANSLRAAAILALLPKIQDVVYIDYLRVDLDREKMSALRALLLPRLILTRFDAFISNSEWTDSTIPRRLSSRPRRIAYPVSGTAHLSEVAPLSREFEPPLTVLSLSRVVAWKGVDVLVDALSILNSEGLADRVQAVVAGGTFHEEAGYAESLIRRAAAIAPNVHFVGHQADVVALLAEADVVASCSVVAEPFGQVVAQGLAAGRPVISTDQGGPREMLRQRQNGLLIEPANPVALANAIQSLLSDRDALREMGDAARISAARFCDDVTSVGLRDAINEILAELHGAGRNAQ